MHVIVAVDDEFSPGGRERTLECHGIDEALVARRRQRRMVNHDDAEQVLRSQIVQHLGNTRDLLLADLAGGHERWRRDRGRDADQPHRPAATQIRKYNLLPCPYRNRPLLTSVTLLSGGTVATSG